MVPTIWWLDIYNKHVTYANPVYNADMIEGQHRRQYASQDKGFSYNRESETVTGIKLKYEF